MQSTFKNNLAAFSVGLIFATGLGLSGMTIPDKVINFLRLGHAWDPSLALVMVGAILVHASTYHLWLKKRHKPLLAPSFAIPTNKKIDARLLGGSALFGIGWAWSGFCPGPAIVSASGLDRPVLIFVFSMIAGMSLFHFYEKYRHRHTLHSPGTQKHHAA